LFISKANTVFQEEFNVKLDSEESNLDAPIMLQIHSRTKQLNASTLIENRNMLSTRPNLLALNED